MGGVEKEEQGSCVVSQSCSSVAVSDKWCLSVGGLCTEVPKSGGQAHLNLHVPSSVELGKVKPFTCYEAS